jgi:hypothetical protein
MACEGGPEVEAYAMSDRELIDTGTDKLYVRRDEKGRFKESDDVGRSLAADPRHKSKTVAQEGQGDRGDRKELVPVARPSAPRLSPHNSLLARRPSVGNPD